MKRISALVLSGLLAIGTLLTGCGAVNTSSVEETKETVSAASESTTNIADQETAKSPTSKLEVHIGDQPSFFILKIADYNGYFTEQFDGTGVKIVVDDFVNQGSAIVEAMNAKDVDLGVIGTMPLVTADANGSNFVAISSVNLSLDGFKLFAGKDSGVKSVEDFKGKKVAVKFSSNEHEMLLTLLAKAGLSEEDVEIANMSAADCLSSLVAGDVDGAILKGNETDSALEGGAYIVADNSQSGIIENALIGRGEFVAEYPEVVDGVLKVLERAKVWIEENPEETVNIYSKLTDSDPKVAKTSFESRVRSISIDADKFSDPIERTINFLVSQGTIDDSLKLEDIIDTSFYENSGIKE